MKTNLTKLASLGLLSTLAVAAYGQGRITGISVNKVGRGVEVQIHGTKLSTPKSALHPTGKAYTLDFTASIADALTKMNVWQNGLEFISASHPTGVTDQTKLSFVFTNRVQAILARESYGYSIVFDASPALASVQGTAKSTAAQPFVLAPEGRSSTLFDVVFEETNRLTRLPAAGTQSAGAASSPGKPSAGNRPGGKSAAASAINAATLRVIKPNLKPKLATTPETATAKNFAPSDAAVIKIHPLTLPAVTTQPRQIQMAANRFAGATNPPRIGPIAATSAPSKPAGRNVTIDFVNTEIIHIMKALAYQTGVNIVTSPDVTGKLTVKLDNVSINDALKLITSLAGLKYGYHGKTVVVTTPAKYEETTKLIGAAMSEGAFSRVVPIFSGQSKQIKMAVTRTLAVSGGSVEVNLPGDSLEAKDGKPAEGQVDQYVMLIGSPSRLDEAEKIVRSTDRQLCVALGISMPTSSATVIETYLTKGSRATDLVEAICGKNKTSYNGVELYATPPSSIAKQSVVLKGREDEVRGVLRAIQQLDSDQARGELEFVSLELKFADPRSVRELLVSGVPGLSVVVAPAGVLNPRVFFPQNARSQSEERGTEAPAPQGGGTPFASGIGVNQNQAMGGVQTNAVDPRSSFETRDNGLIGAFNALETVGVPMRLILRGSPEQIAMAREYVKQLDVAPKQVAVELRVMEISREQLTRLGIDWSAFTGGAVKFIRFNNSQTDPSNRIGIGINSGGVGGDIVASLDAIANDSNLISRPNIIVNDGRESELFVGDAIRYIESIISTQNGVTVTTGTVRAGVRLEVFPRIGDDGTISMDVRTGVTYLRGFKPVPQIGGELPQTSERLNQQTLLLKSGDTVAIGGLIQQQDRNSVSGLPILKDLPIVGQLFRRTSIDKVKTELVFFLTAVEVDHSRMNQARLPMTESDRPSQPALSEKASKVLKEAEKKRSTAVVNSATPKQSDKAAIKGAKRPGN